jgi:hypothetical protein
MRTNVVLLSTRELRSAALRHGAKSLLSLTASASLDHQQLIVYDALQNDTSWRCHSYELLDRSPSDMRGLFAMEYDGD